MQVRGIRGATTVNEDNSQEIFEATRELLASIQEENNFEVQDIASILFTVTADLKSAFPAEAARNMGWHRVPLLCFQEIGVQGALPKCIRVLVHINTSKGQGEIKHIYLRNARVLREDLL